MSLFNFNEILEEMSYEYNDDLVESGYPLEECGWMHLEESIMSDSIDVMEAMYVIGAEQVQYGAVTENAFKTAWEKVKAFLKMIWEKIKAFFKWLFGLFKKRTKDNQTIVKEAEKEAEEVKAIVLRQKTDLNASENVKKSVDKIRKTMGDNPPSTSTDVVPFSIDFFISQNCKHVKRFEDGKIVIDRTTVKPNLYQGVYSKPSIYEGIEYLIKISYEFLMDVELYLTGNKNANDIVDIAQLFDTFTVGAKCTVDPHEEKLTVSDLKGFMGTLKGAYESKEKIQKYRQELDKIEKLTDRAMANTNMNKIAIPPEAFSRIVKTLQEIPTTLMDLINRLSEAINVNDILYKEVMLEIKPILGFLK